MAREKSQALSRDGRIRKKFLIFFYTFFKTKELYDYGKKIQQHEEKKAPRSYKKAKNRT